VATDLGGSVRIPFLFVAWLVSNHIQKFVNQRQYVTK
jgi:hypothetical protein